MTLGIPSAMSILAILTTTLPIYLIMIAGGVARKLRWMPRETDQGIMHVTVRLLFPCLILERIIGNSALTDPRQVMLAALLGFGIAAIAVFVSYFTARVLGMNSGAGARAFAISTGFQNYGFVAIPVTEALFGKHLIGVLFTFSVGVEFAMWTVGVGMLTGFGKAPWRHAINAPVISTLVALALHYGGAAPYIPQAVHTFLASLGACAIPISLLLIGGSIADLIGSERLRWNVAITSVVMRQILLPVMMLAIASLFPINQELKQVICVQAAMPAAVFTIVIARHYGGHAPTAVLVVLATSFASLFTIPLAIQFGIRFLGL